MWCREIVSSPPMRISMLGVEVEVEVMGVGW